MTPQLHYTMMSTTQFSLTRHLARRIATAGVLAVAVTMAACSNDNATGPGADVGAAAFARGGVQNGGTNYINGATTSANNLISKTGLSWNTTVQRPITRSFIVPRSIGTTWEIPELGFKMQVPSGAISSSSLVIPVTALPGKAVAYSFEPHGTQFLKALVIHQDLSFTSWAGSTGFAKLGAGYFKDDAQVNPLSGVVHLDEILPAKVTGNRVHFEVKHFSGYMVSMD
jgi:hypothetical protein